MNINHHNSSIFVIIAPDKDTVCIINVYIYFYILTARNNEHGVYLFLFRKRKTSFNFVCKIPLYFFFLKNIKSLKPKRKLRVSVHLIE